MKQACLCVVIAIGLTLPAFPFGAWAQSCAPGPATAQILGSGGPVASRERASSSYLLWVGGLARMLIDAGGGARYAEAKGEGTFEGARQPALALRRHQLCG
jgi:hypothetical protein